MAATTHSQQIFFALPFFQEVIFRHALKVHSFEYSSSILIVFSILRPQSQAVNSQTFSQDPIQLFCGVHKKNMIDGELFKYFQGQW